MKHSLIPKPNNWISNKNCWMLAEEMMFRYRRLSENVDLRHDFLTLIKKLIACDIIFQAFFLFWQNVEKSETCCLSYKNNSIWTELSWLVLECRRRFGKKQWFILVPIWVNMCVICTHTYLHTYTWWQHLNFVTDIVK